MRAVLQRVKSASVLVEAETISKIGEGLLVLAAITHSDSEHQARALAQKIRSLRIFDDGSGRMNVALGDRQVLCVSQFTLYGRTDRGTRPSFTEAAAPQQAQPLYDLLCRLLDAERGRFGSHMEIELIADGPVTILLDA